MARGVNVRALTAHTNRGGEKSLRKLELQLLEGGVTVSRTADDLVRYHGKMMIVDAACCTSTASTSPTLDIEQEPQLRRRSRRTSKLVQEAVKLFEADFNRQPYRRATSGLSSARRTRASGSREFIKGARQAAADLRPAGRATTRCCSILASAREGRRRRADHREGRGEVAAQGEKFPGRRLHVRAIIRDGRGRSSAARASRKLELEKRREVGVIVDDRKVVDEMRAVFEVDWDRPTEGGKKAGRGGEAWRPRCKERRMTLVLRFDGPRALADLLADLHRAGEDRADRDEAPQLVAGDRGEAGRRDAAAVGAVGRLRRTGTA